MGFFRFRRTFKIAPGLRVNLSKSGISGSVGKRGAWFTLGPRGTRETVGIPGTGMSYTGQQSARTPDLEATAPMSPPGTSLRWIAWLLASVVAAIVLALLR